MDWTDSDTPAFPAYGRNDRCPHCDVRVGAAHLRKCIYTGLCKARLEDNKRRKAR